MDGRPKNGMFIAVPDEIIEFVADVSPNHWRVQAITLQAPSNRLLIINSYFPNDPKTSEFDTSELLTTLSAINSVMDGNDFDNVIWAGDINADFIRNTQLTNIIDRFIDENSLHKSWDKFTIKYTLIFDIDGHSHTSTLDHFFWSEDISNNIKEADVLHIASNTSDHCPIYCNININNLQAKCRTNLLSKAKACWKKATGEQKADFKANMENDLANLETPASIGHCHDVHCKDDNHKHDSDNFVINILNTIKSTSDSYIPFSGQKHNGNKSPIFNWREEIQPYKEKALFWHAIWQSAGRPINTELHRIMKRTRNVYHLHIRKNKKMAQTLKRNALLEACISDKGDIFEVIKAQRKAAHTVSTMIDGVNTNIESHFANIYKQLYNSIDDRDALMKVKQNLKDRINSSSLNDVQRITPSIVEEAIGRLKNNKSDPLFVFSSECLKNAPMVLCEHLTLLFRHYLTHGYISLELMLSTLIPLVKDKLGDITSSNNYRSIALSSLILKVFDWVVLLLHKDCLNIDELQFGFQQDTSTNMCTWLAIETIEYYLRNGSEVFACVMDMTKAFDKVQHSKLFLKLAEKGISPIFIRLLLEMYENQQANVRWNGVISKSFPITNGVKQGAVLSPILYCIYIDGLFTRLRKEKTGCWVNDNYVGIVAYADDLLLLSPSLNGLQEMTKTCEDYGNTHNLTFSTDPIVRRCKTKCLAFLKKERNLKNITLNGRDLP